MADIKRKDRGSLAGLALLVALVSLAAAGLPASPTYTQACAVRRGASSGTGVSSVWTAEDCRTRSHISRYSGSSTPAHAITWSHRVERWTGQPSRPRMPSKRRAWRRELLNAEIHAALRPGATEKEIAVAAERLLSLAA